MRWQAVDRLDKDHGSYDALIDRLKAETQWPVRRRIIEALGIFPDAPGTAALADVLALAAEELFTHNVTLISRLPEKPLVANVDADLLKQAVLNVIQNGAQAMPEGGRLEVILEESRKTSLLRIADEGTGIPDDLRGKIFDLYFTTKAGGSGIGLAMTYRILQLHHGSVEVQSRQGCGTEFLLRIPLIATDWGRRNPPPANIQIEKGLAG